MSGSARVPRWAVVGAALTRGLIGVELALTAFFGAWRRVSLASDWPVITWVLANPAALVGVVLVGVWLVGATVCEWHLTRREAWWARPPVRGLTGVVLAAWASLLVLAAWAAPTAYAPSVAWAGVGRLALVLALGVGAWLARPRVMEVALALGLGAGVQGIVGIAQFVKQSSLGLTLLGEIQGLAPRVNGVSVIALGDVHWMRAYGLAAHPNVLGGFLVIALILVAGALVVSAWPRAVRVAGWGLLSVGMIALILTFSRSAWVGLVVGGAAALWAWRGALRRAIGSPVEWGRRWRAPVVAVALVVVVGLGLQGFIGGRLFALDNPLEARSIDERLFYSDVALRLIAQRPWQGYGLDNFPLAVHALLHETQYTIGYPFVHNVTLLAGVELGVGGSVMWLGLGALPFVVGLLGARVAPGGSGALWAGALGAAWLAVWVISFFDYYAWSSLRNSMVWPVLLGMWMAYWPDLMEAWASPMHPVPSIQRGALPRGGPQQGML